MQWEVSLESFHKYETLNYFVNYFNYFSHDLISIETGEKRVCFGKTDSLLI